MKKLILALVTLFALGWGSAASAHGTNTVDTDVFSHNILHIYDPSTR